MSPPTTTDAPKAPAVDSPPGIHLVDAGAAAARAVAIVRDRLDGGATTDRIVVLARVNSALLPIQVALTDAGIGHSAPLDPQVLGRTGIRTALAYLRLGLDPDRMQKADILDTLNRPARKVKSAIQPFLQRSSRWSMGQLEQILDSLDGVQNERFAGYLGDLHHLTHEITAGADTARCLWIIRNRIGLGDAMEALDSSTTRPEGSSHGDDLDALQQLADDHPDPVTFRERLVERLGVPADPGGVTLSTVHRVKGLEWDHVVVVAANDGLFPHRLSEDVEEERRVFHVAVTRCRLGVDVVADRSRPSPFVAELTRPPAEPRTRDRDGAAPPTDVTPRPAARGATVADVGLRVTLPGGLEGAIVRLEGQVAVVSITTSLGQVVTRVPFGQPVEVAGTATTLAAAPRVTRPGVTPGRLVDVGGDDGPADPVLLEALKAWRTRTAQATNSPAFLIFHDRTLEAVAARKPGSVRELGAIPGIGPAKLERFADDLLELVDAHP